MDKIQQTLDKIFLALEGLKQTTVTASKLITRTMVANEASSASVAAYNAKAYLANNTDPEIKTDFYYARIMTQEAADHLRSNEWYWRRIFLPEALYEDIWSGVAYPDGVSAQGAPDDCIWDYRMAMPAFLEIIACRSIVLLASSSGEQAAHTDEMLGLADGLCERYLKILGNIRTIRPPSYQELADLIPATNDGNFYVLDVEDSTTHLPLSSAERNEILQNWVPGGRWRLANYLTGVVEAWTGYRCAVGYPRGELDTGAAYLALTGSFWVSGANMAGAKVSIKDPQAFQAFYDRFVLRHALRTEVQRQRLFNELGLRGILNSIRFLYATLHAAPSQWLPDCSVRSIREAFDLIAPARQPSAMEGGAISLRKMADVIGVSAPLSARSILLMDENLAPA